METLAAIALAGNILQFAGTVKDIVSSSRQLSDLGATKDRIELGSIAEKLQSLVARVTPTESPEGIQLSEEEKSIRALSVQCHEVAQELLEVLDTLKVNSTDGRFDHLESFYKVLLAEWKRPKVDDLTKRLNRIESSIHTHLTSYDSSKILRRLDELSTQDTRLQAHRDGEIRELRKQMISVFNGIGDKLQERDSRDRTMNALLGAAARGSRYSAEQIILEQLRFDEIDYRYDTIREAHEHTLSWLFSTGEQRSPASFYDWLGSDDDLYWISGKPGSGKSTLMKFLSHHPRTIQRLSIWAKQKRVVTAEYFFWEAGKSLQKSQEGLLRSLLYDILRQYPDIIPQAYPNIWRLYFPEGNDWRPHVTIPKGPGATIPLSVHGLLNTLGVISNVAMESDSKFLFCIDGLDEYEGQANDIIELVRQLRNLQNLKLCVSSRPWNEFESEFSKFGYQKLYMQDFNSADISAYVYDTFVRDENYQELEDRDLNGKLLLDEIVQSANGVFFWVFLVVRSFQEGLQNGDTASDLRERLKLLPKDLNTYFDRIILSDVEEFYHGHSAEMFTVTLAGEEDIPLIAYWFMREDADYVVGLEAKPLSIQQVNKRLKDTVKRLNASCKGLLEVRYFAPRNEQDEQSSLPSTILFDRQVGFLHRTVREYLMLDATKIILRDWRSVGFDSHRTICKMLLAQIKISPEEHEYSASVSRLEEMFRNHYRMISSSGEPSVTMKLQQDLSKVLRCRQAISTLQEDRPNHKDSESLLAQQFGSALQISQPNCNGSAKDGKRMHSNFIRRLYRRFTSMDKLAR
jgi:NACHT domain